MRSREWSLLIVLALLNYIMLASLFGIVRDELRFSEIPATRTPWPTFTPTYPPPLPALPTPTSTRVIVAGLTGPMGSGRMTHVVQPGENLPAIAQRYGVSAQAIVLMNGLLNPTGLNWGQSLIIPGSEEAIPTWTPEAPPDTPTPEPTNTRKPRPTATDTPPAPTATDVPRGPQFTGEIVRWYANCGATGVHRPSKIFGVDGEPLNGLRVRIWYENMYEGFSLVSGIGGDYGPGEFDIALRSGETGKFKMAVWDWQTGPNQFARVDSQVMDIQFDYDWQECQPGRSGHQSAVVNWYRHW